MLRDVRRPGAVGGVDTESQHAGAVVRFPPEQVRGQPLLVRSGTHEDVTVQPALFEDLWQGAVVAEAVRVIANPGRDAELLFEVALPVQPLADERLAAGDIAVRFHPPATDDLPASLGHALPDLGEHRRVAVFYPFVERRRAGGENKIVKLVHPVESRTEGCPDLLEALVPTPQPD